MEIQLEHDLMNDEKNLIIKDTGRILKLKLTKKQFLKLCEFYNILTILSK
jgi:hypothetical protein